MAGENPYSLPCQDFWRGLASSAARAGAKGQEPRARGRAGREIAGRGFFIVVGSRWCWFYWLWCWCFFHILLVVELFPSRTCPALKMVRAGVIVNLSFNRRPRRGC